LEKDIIVYIILLQENAKTANYEEGYKTSLIGMDLELMKLLT